METSQHRHLRRHHAAPAELLPPRLHLLPSDDLHQYVLPLLHGHPLQRCAGAAPVLGDPGIHPVRCPIDRSPSDQGALEDLPLLAHLPRLHVLMDPRHHPRMEGSP